MSPAVQNFYPGQQQQEEEEEAAGAGETKGLHWTQAGPPLLIRQKFSFCFSCFGIEEGEFCLLDSLLLPSPPRHSPRIWWGAATFYLFLKKV